MPSAKKPSPRTTKQPVGLSAGLERWRMQISAAEALPILTLLGLVIGVISGTVILVFRYLVEAPLTHFLPVNAENFEGLSSIWHFWLPVIGAGTLGLVMQFVHHRYHGTSVGHVLDRIHNHQGRLPLGNTLYQLLGGAWCLMSGQSVGREGPAVHLGASSGSLLGQWLHLPNNSLRPLAGCGVAAAIAACFNTPLAGVIFAMEVVVMEYSIAGFIPVILAAVAGTSITQAAFGNAIALHAPSSMATPLHELPILMVTGLVIGVLASAYIFIHATVSANSVKLPVWIKFLAVGLVAGAGAYFTPQIMGVGYDSIAQAIDNQFTLKLLLILVIMKLVITGVSLGAGLPGGVIGPLLFMGACAGGAIGNLAHLYAPEQASSVGFYVILGMGAMMGATLNAPLAAMMTILELTYSPEIIFPSMITVVLASLTARWGFGFKGLFQTVLEKQGKKSSFTLTEQLFSSQGILHQLETSLFKVDSNTPREQIYEQLNQGTSWFYLADHQCAIGHSSLTHYLDLMPAGSVLFDAEHLPDQRVKLIELDARCHVQQAIEALQKAEAQGAVVHLPRQGKTGLLFLEQLLTY